MIITDQLQPDDIPQLWAIDKTVWTPQNTPALQQYEDYDAYAASLWHQSLLLAKEEATGKVLGCVSYHHPSPLPAHRRHWVLGIAIAPEAQGQQVGRQLMAELIRRGTEAGIGKLSLEVFATNPGARKFYQKIGFVDEGLAKREFWINETWVDEYRMAYYIGD